MGNCLKTQLKEDVQNNSLLKVGEIRCECTKAAECYVVGVSGISIEIKDLSGDFISPSGQSTISGGAFTAPVGHIISITSKYDLGVFNGQLGLKTKIKDFEYSDNLREIGCIPIGNLDDFRESDNIQRIILSNGEIYGDISNFAKFKNLTLLQLGANIGNIYGNVESLGGLTKLDEIKLGECFNVNGTIEGFVAGQREAGRTTGTINFNYAYMGGITFNGNSLPTVSSAELSWDASTITYNGVTINA